MADHVYGPVPSRRLGRSLGVDLVPLKVCTYDCIYCQLGRTTNKTLQRREYVPLEDVLSQLDRRLRGGPALDTITLAGSGEPCLHARLGEAIRAIKQRTPTPVAVLTNGSLLGDRRVRDALRDADLVLPSLDAGDERLFQYVNRPHRDISFEAMVSGLIALRGEFPKPIWLEVLLLGGVTAIASEVEKLARLIDRIRPDRVQVNTVVRPPAEAFALTVPEDQLRGFAAMLGDRAEVIVGGHAPPAPRQAVADAQVLALVARRPCTSTDVAEALGLHPAEALKRLGRLLGERRLATRTQNGRLFYVPPSAPGAG